MRCQTMDGNRKRGPDKQPRQRPTKERYEMNPLMARPSPRDIPEVKEESDKIKIEKLWVKYYQEKEAYTIIQDYFLDHKQYTHLVIAPDDLVVTREAFDRIRHWSVKYRLQVIAGICNLSWQERDKFSCCQSVSGFRFATEEDFDNHRWYDGRYRQLIEVGHEGFACSCIRRDVFENYNIRLDDGMNDDKSAHFDWAFSLKCNKAGIPIYVDKKARMLHLRNRLGEGVLENKGVGLKQPTVILQRVNEKYNEKMPDSLQESTENEVVI